MAKKILKKAAEIDFPSVYRIVSADQSIKRPGFCKMLVDKTTDKPVISEIGFTNVDNKRNVKPHGQLLDEILREMAFFFPDEEDGIPTYYVREKVAQGSMPLAMIGIAKVHGQTDWFLWRLEKTWADIGPSQIKKILTGNGKADKTLVTKAQSDYLGEQSYSCDDESDAAAVAIAWLISQKQLEPPNQEGVNNA